MDESLERLEILKSKYEVETDLVLDVLFMYIDILIAYEYYKDQIDFDKYYVTFKGFDLYSETRYFHCCHEILEDILREDDRFDIIRCNKSTPNYESHRPIISQYEQMLEIYNKYKGVRRLYPLPVPCIEKILGIQHAV